MVILNLKQRIMLRVAGVCVKRFFKQPITQKMGMFAVLLVLAGMFTSVTHVLANAPEHNWADWVVFYTKAFLNTELAMQLSIVGMAIAGGWISKDIVSALTRSLFVRRRPAPALKKRHREA